MIKGSLAANTDEAHPVQSIQLYLANRQPVNDMLAAIRMSIMAKGHIKAQLRLAVNMLLPGAKNSEEQWFASFALPIQGTEYSKAALRTMFEQITQEVDD